MNMIPTDNIESFPMRPELQHACHGDCLVPRAGRYAENGMLRSSETKVPEVVDCKHMDPRAAGGCWVYKANEFILWSNIWGVDNGSGPICLIFPYRIGPSSNLKCFQSKVGIPSGAKAPGNGRWRNWFINSINLSDGQSSKSRWSNILEGRIMI